MVAHTDPISLPLTLPPPLPSPPLPSLHTPHLGHLVPNELVSKWRVRNVVRGEIPFSQEPYKG